MATIMTQGNSDGTRRCDSTCHNAKSAGCRCICGGRYHGAGSSDKAREMLTEDWLGKDWRDTKATVEAAGDSFQEHVSEAIKRALDSGLVIHTRALNAEAPRKPPVK